MKFNSDNAREMGRKGGTNKGINSQKRRAMKETFNMLLGKAMRGRQIRDGKDIEELAKRNGLNVSAQDAIAIAMIVKASKGDVQAATFIRDTLGEKEPEKVEVGMTYEEYVKSHKSTF